MADEYDFSSSSALPPGDEKPALIAPIHKLSSSSLFENLNKLDYRVINHQYIEQLRELHLEWFPIYYENDFYEDIESGSTFGFVAILEQDDEEFVVGAVTLSRNPKLIKECDLDLISAWYNISDLVINLEKKVMYMLTMGIADKFRRCGIGKNLIEMAMNYIFCHFSDVSFLYLHVVDYNIAAMKLYESLNFDCIDYRENFYCLHGKLYGGYLYVYHFHERPLIPSLDELTVNCSSNKSLLDINLVSMVKNALKKSFGCSSRNN